MSSVAAGGLQITEFCASVDDSTAKGIGPASDWIEIFNPGPDAVTLSDYALTDDKTDLLKWRFPDHHFLLPDTYALVMASGQDIPDSETEWHANFSLKSDGEFLALVEARSKTIVRAFDPFPTQRSNVSYDGTHYHLQPTPGKANRISKRVRLAASPRFSLASGTFSKSVTVALSCDEGDAIYYSTNGRAPIVDPAHRYREPVLMTTTTLLRAVTSAEDAVPSTIHSESFIAIDPELEKFSSNLPILIIERFDEGEIGPYFERARMLFSNPRKTAGRDWQGAHR